MTPIYIQKIILFLLQRGTKTFSLKIKGLFEGSLEYFTMVRKYIRIYLG